MALFKGGALADDLWRHMPDDGYVSNGVPTILPLGAWLEQRDALKGREQMLGVRIEPGETLGPMIPDLERLGVVALSFPKFADGRSFSKATMLREEHGYRGEIRAVGDVLWDQLQLMRRCGFDTFEIIHEPTLKALAAGKKPFWARRAVG